MQQYSNTYFTEYFISWRTEVECISNILKGFENASPRLNPLFHKPGECQRDNCYCIS